MVLPSHFPFLFLHIKIIEQVPAYVLEKWLSSSVGEKKFTSLYHNVITNIPGEMYSFEKRSDLFWFAIVITGYEVILIYLKIATYMR